jgi:hypothetical protein
MGIPSLPKLRTSLSAIDVEQLAVAEVAHAADLLAIGVEDADLRAHVALVVLLDHADRSARREDLHRAFGREEALVVERDDEAGRTHGGHERLERRLEARA